MPSRDYWQAMQQGFTISTPAEQWLADTWQRASTEASRLAAQVREWLFGRRTPAPAPVAPLSLLRPPLAAPQAAERWNQIRQGFAVSTPQERWLLDAMNRWLQSRGPQT